MNLSLATEAPAVPCFHRLNCQQSAVQYRLRQQVQFDLYGTAAARRSVVVVNNCILCALQMYFRLD